MLFFALGLATQLQRDECGCPVCPKCNPCRECRKCPKCPTPLPCPACPECPEVGRCRVCEICKPCAPPVVFYVPKGAFIDPFDEGTPTPETANMIPGMCCRCPKRKQEGVADAEKYVEQREEEEDETNSGERMPQTLASQIEEMQRKIRENRKTIKKLKEKKRNYEARLG